MLLKKCVYFNQFIINNFFRLSDVASGASSNKSDDDNIDLDDDDFLDNIDISFQVAEQIEDRIKLNDN